MKIYMVSLLHRATIN